jgi:hypothetical protein
MVDSGANSLPESCEKLSGEVTRILFVNPDNQYCVITVLTPDCRTETMCGTGID